MQVSLLPNGHVEMTYDRNVTFEHAVVGLSPGGTATLEAVDLSDPGPTSGGSGAIGERFSDQDELDVVAVASRFAASHFPMPMTSSSSGRTGRSCSATTGSPTRSASPTTSGASGFPSTTIPRTSGARR